MFAKIFGRHAGSAYFDIGIALFIILIFLSSGGLTPRAFRLPFLIGSATLVLIAFDLFAAFRSAGSAAAKKTGETKSRGIDKDLMKKLLVTLGFMAATVVLWEIVGFVAASIVVTIGFGKYLGAKSMKALILSSILLTIALYLVFGVFLGVPLPWGLLSGLM
jgi:hypothetical protein